MSVPERFRAGIARAGPEDREELATFRERMFGAGSRQTDAARHEWLFDRNPANEPDGPGIWLCRRDGEIVGQQAEIPFEVVAGRDERRAAWAIDLMVDRTWRLRGLGPALIAAQAQGKAITAGLNLSEQGYTAYKRNGWTDLGIIPVYVRPLDARRALQKAPVGRSLRALAPVAGPLFRLADGILAVLTRLRRLRLVPVDRFDERVDAIWSASVHHYPVLARRDRDTVAWRIDGRPDRDRLQRYYLLRGRRPLGYAVLRPTTWQGTSAVVVVDYLAPPAWVAPLLGAAGRAAARRGATAMTVKTRNVAADRPLRRHGFIRRERLNDPPIRFMIRCADEPGICALVEAPETWFITSADSDLDHATADGDEGTRGDGGTRPVGG